MATNFKSCSYGCNLFLCLHTLFFIDYFPSGTYPLSSSPFLFFFREQTRLCRSLCLKPQLNFLNVFFFVVIRLGVCPLIPDHILVLFVHPSAVPLQLVLADGWLRNRRWSLPVSYLGQIFRPLYYSYLENECESFKKSDNLISSQMFLSMLHVTKIL